MQLNSIASIHHWQSPALKRQLAQMVPQSSANHRCLISTCRIRVRSLTFVTLLSLTHRPLLVPKQQTTPSFVIIIVSPTKPKHCTHIHTHPPRKRLAAAATTAAASEFIFSLNIKSIHPSFSTLTLTPFFFFLENTVFPTKAVYTMDPYSMESDSEAGSIQASPVIFNGSEQTFGSSSSATPSASASTTSSSHRDFSESSSSQTSLRQPISSSAFHSVANNNINTSSVTIDMVDADDTDSSYEVAHRYLEQHHSTDPDRSPESTSSRVSASGRVKSFLPFLGYQSLRNKVADEHIAESTDPQEQQGLYEPEQPSSQDRQRYYNTHPSDYKEQAPVSPASASSAANRRPAGARPLYVNTTPPAPVENRRPAKKSSTQFSKKLVFSDMHEVPLESASKPLDAVEVEEDDSLLPLKFASPPRPVYNATRQSMPPLTSNRVMTKSQFEDYRKSILGPELLGQSDVLEAQLKKHDAKTNQRSSMHDFDTQRVETGESEDDDESDDEELKKLESKYEQSDASKESVRMRLKQDAHLSVYRQKMTKLAGSQTPSIPGLAQRPSSTYNMHVEEGDDDDDDEYDDVPLGILKAHGFPTQPINGLKAAGSKPNTLSMAGPTPSILFRGPKLAPDTQSLRSYRSVGNLHSSPSPPALPSVFGDPTQALNRGLVGEIAREEEAKQRRKSFGNILLASQSDHVNRSSASLAAGSIYNGLSSSASMPIVSSAPSSEIQAQLQQVMQMQMQMLHQIQGGPAPAPAPSSMMPGSNRHSMFVGAPGSAMNGAASVRSMATGLSRPMSADVLNHPGSRQSIDFNSAASVGLRGYRSQHFHPSSPGPNGGRATPAMLQQSSKLEESDDEDDEDEGWKQMMEKRRAMKEMWAKQPSAPLVL